MTSSNSQSGNSNNYRCLCAWEETCQKGQQIISGFILFHFSTISNAQKRDWRTCICQSLGQSTDFLEGCQTSVQIAKWHYTSQQRAEGDFFLLPSVTTLQDIVILEQTNDASQQQQQQQQQHHSQPPQEIKRKSVPKISRNAQDDRGGDTKNRKLNHRQAKMTATLESSNVPSDADTPATIDADESRHPQQMSTTVNLDQQQQQHSSNNNAPSGAKISSNDYSFTGKVPFLRRTLVPIFRTEKKGGILYPTNSIGAMVFSVASIIEKNDKTESRSEARLDRKCPFCSFDAVRNGRAWNTQFISKLGNARREEVQSCAGVRTLD
jgi:hypothetical protein